jgi:arylsulfatase
MKLIPAVIGCSLLAMVACTQQPGQQADNSADERPNILLVVADDLGWTDLGSYGGEVDTPNLDALAEAGLMFTDFHTSVSCSPTRSMLMSGNDNHIAGLGNMGELLTPNQMGQPGYEGHINDRVATLAEVLRDGGYRTFMAGKWHLGHEEGSLPYNRGFERSFSMLVGGASHWSDRLGILPQDDPAAYSLNGEHLESLPADFYSSRSYADFLADAIRESVGDGKPFLGYLSFTAVHDPLHVPEPWLSKYHGRYDEGYDVWKERRWEAARARGVVPAGAQLAPYPDNARRWDDLSDDEKAMEVRGMEVYAGMLDAMDYHLGRVLDFLRDIGEYDNTIIIFLSDNGANAWYSIEYPGADEPDFAAQFDYNLKNIGHPGSNYAYGMGWSRASGGPLDKHKMTVGEGGIRVPLMVSGPGINGGRQTGAFAYVWDIVPTVLDIAGLDYPSQYQGRVVEAPRGRSLLPLLDGSVDELYGEDEYVGGEMGGGKWMRRGSYKAVSVAPPYGDGEWRLYNVDEDPGEANDLAGQMPDMLEELIASWERYAEDVGVIPPE